MTSIDYRIKNKIRSEILYELYKSPIKIKYGVVFGKISDSLDGSLAIRKQINREITKTYN